MTLQFDNQKLIDVLNNVADTCTHYSNACLVPENVPVVIDCIKLDVYCSTICKLAVSLLTKGSPHAQKMLKECIDVCNFSATEYEKHAQYHEHSNECAIACRACAEVCSSVFENK